MKFCSTDKYIEDTEMDGELIVKYEKDANIVTFDGRCSSFSKDEVINMLESIRKLLED